MRKPQSSTMIISIQMREWKLYASSQRSSEKIMWLVNIFRVKFLDTSEIYMTIEVIGDPGKLAIILRNAGKFRIKEIARTGKIALRRESMGESAPFWRFSASSSSRMTKLAIILCTIFLETVFLAKKFRFHKLLMSGTYNGMSQSSSQHGTIMPHSWVYHQSSLPPFLISTLSSVGGEADFLNKRQVA